MTKYTKLNPINVYPKILMKYGADPGIFTLTLASLHWEGSFEFQKDGGFLIDQSSMKGKINIESLGKARYTIQSSDVRYAAKVRGVVDDKTIERYMKLLVKDGAMNTVKMSDKEAAWKIQQKTPQVSAVYFGHTCGWCGSDTACLHDHHYPMRRSHGGIETVSICPNCHTEFHQLTDWNLYAFSEQFLTELEDLQDGVA
jgi:hypothetical protein